MSEEGQYGRNMELLLAKVVKFIVAEGRTYVSFNMINHNGMNFTKKGEYDILTAAFLSIRFGENLINHDKSWKLKK